MKVNLKTITPNIETTIVEIARVSSSRKDKTEKPEGLINYLINNNHFSPFQHGYLTFEITTSKAIAIQYLRHLSFTFQEFSQRYAVVESFEPIEFRLQAEKNRQSSTDIVGTVHIKENSHSVDVLNEYLDLEELLLEVGEYLNTGKLLYKKLLDSGIAKECARMILPMASQTTLYMTGSVRSWIHLLQIRDDSHSQKEAQLIAKEIKTIFKKELPLISKALNY